MAYFVHLLTKKCSIISCKILYLRSGIKLQNKNVYVKHSIYSSLCCVEQSQLREISEGGRGSSSLVSVPVFPLHSANLQHGVCCLYRKIIQEASYPNPSHKVMVSVPPSEPQFHVQSHPCRMETESMIPITFHLIFSKHIFVLLLFLIPASIIACFPRSPIPGKSSSAFVLSPVTFSHLCHSFPDRT